MTIKIQRFSFRKPALGLLLSLLLHSCATHDPQFGSKSPTVIQDNFSNANISHTFFLLGDAGNWDTANTPTVLSELEQRLAKADTASTLLILGDNIYPNGMPLKGARDRESAERKLNQQLAITKNFKGRTLFLTGNHDWRTGLEGLNEQERMINDFYKTNAFQPANSCGLSEVAINANTALIIINSTWFLENWDNHPTINSGCAIITRDQFFDELEVALNKNQNKTVILAIHHPLMTNGSHGGEYSLLDNLFPLENNIPLPIIGTMANLVRKTSGISTTDLQNKKYNAMAQRIKTLITNKPNIIVVSGHDHNLQYIETDGVRQIVSGAGSKEEAAKAKNKRDFSYGRYGYADLKIHKNGAAKVSFYGVPNGKEALLFEQQTVYPRPKFNVREYPTKFESHKDTSVYTHEMTQKGNAYRFFWGNHFRKYYSVPVHVRQVSLDTLYGGLKPTISDGIDQSRTLLLESGRERLYTMKALRRSGTRLLQAEAFKDQSVEQDFRDTYTENFILDFYTTAHPYAPFVVAKLAGNIGLNHTNPELYYIPKQKALGLFNENFGDELYLIEQSPTNESKNLAIFGKPLRIVTTDTVLANIKADFRFSVDEDEYIKARLFDMLVGDWDRHADQWSWGEYKVADKIIYRPIPLDRDQAFSKFDGALLMVAMNFPPVRHMKTFDEDFKSARWFNRLAYNMDLAFLPNATEADWIKQAEIVVKSLTDTEIDRAFKSLPSEVRDASADQIRAQLKSRKTKLADYASEYYKVLQKTVLIVGTAKSDRFEIARNGNATNVKIYESSSVEPYFDMTYKKPRTKEIWIYGLDGEDVFNVRGSGSRKILLRILGGQDRDTYVAETGPKVKIYDSKTQVNDVSASGSATLRLSDSYAINSYDYQKPLYNIFGSLPSIGYNPDDGFKVGVAINYTVNRFKRAPFTQKHAVNANYFFATQGYELLYKGTFPHIIGKWDLVVDFQYTSPNFSTNFFGFGNETPDKGDMDLDFNRVKIRTIKALPSLRWTSELGSSAAIQAGFERNKVERTDSRFIAQPGVVDPGVFDYKNFADINATYAYENYDNPANPTLGMSFSLTGGYKYNIDEQTNSFPYAESLLGFNYRLTNSGKWIIASVIKGRALFDNGYEFYHAATVGGDSDLRGFRNQRFSGKQSLYHSTDLRWNLGKLKNGLAPVRYGVFGGFDYGRIWLQNDDSDKWHQSVGGGVYLNGVNLLVAKLALFVSSDGPRLSFGLGFGF